MEPLLKPTGEFVGLFPYRKGAERYEYFLQKRDMNALRNPGRFSTFGGKCESGEEILESLLRELKEELDYVPKNVRYFARYTRATSIGHFFIEEVGSDFEDQVIVQEGEFGVFKTMAEVIKLDTSPMTWIAIQEVDEYLNSK